MSDYAYEKNQYLYDEDYSYDRFIEWLKKAPTQELLEAFAKTTFKLDKTGKWGFKMIKKELTNRMKKESEIL